MNIVEESFKTTNEQKKKSPILKIIIAMIIIIILTIVGLLAYVSYMEGQVLRLTIDNKVNENFKSSLVFEQDTIYVPIKSSAPYFGSIEAYNGHYEAREEAANKAYVRFENEVVNFTLGSSTIEKLDLTSGNNNYEYTELVKPVKSINGVLYASSDMIEKAFNIVFEYDVDNNKIEIYTLPFLVTAYETVVLDYGYAGLSEEFVNQKAILDSRLIVEKENSDNNFGVISLEGDTIIEAKYDDIRYLTATKDYQIETNDKVGILTDSGDFRIKAQYDSIEILDQASSLYLVENNNKYGVIDFQGLTKIHIEYDEIGINIDRYEQSELKNEFVILNSLIPVYNGDFWAVFDKNGKNLTGFVYDSFGYTASSNKQAMNLLIIPGYNVMVIEKNEKYALINTSGKELFNVVADDIYMNITDGEKHYYIGVNNQVIDAEEYLDSLGVQNVQEDDDEVEQNEEAEDSNTNNTENTNNTNNTNNNDNTENTNNNENTENTQGNETTVENTEETNNQSNTN